MAGSENPPNKIKHERELWETEHWLSDFAGFAVSLGRCPLTIAGVTVPPGNSILEAFRSHGNAEGTTLSHLRGTSFL